MARKAERHPQRVILKAEVGGLRGGVTIVSTLPGAIEHGDTVAVAPIDVETILVEGHAFRPELLVEFSPSLGLADLIAVPGKAQQTMFNSEPHNQRSVAMKGEAVCKAGHPRKARHVAVGARQQQLAATIWRMG